MLNTLLHFADATLQYYRGKQTGIWGLIGIALTIVIALTWNDLVYPAMKFIGLVPALEGLGIIAAEAELTAFRLFFLAVGISLVLMLLTLLLITLFMFVIMGFTNIQGTKIESTLMKGLLVTVFFPFVFMAFTAKLFMHLSDMKRKRNDPEGYAEEKRLEKNADVIQFLTYGNCKEGESNILSHQEAYHRLNRLPTVADHSFLVGITKDREMYAILPRPFGVMMYGSYNKVLIEKLNVREYNKNLEKPLAFDQRQPQYLVVSMERENWNSANVDMEREELEQFEVIVTCTNLEDLTYCFKNYTYREIYLHYVTAAQDQYFNKKEELVNKLSSSNSKERFEEITNVLKNYNVGNEDIVKYIWEANKHSQAIQG